MALLPCRTICAAVVAAAIFWNIGAEVWADDLRAALVVSRKIRPYIQVMEGVVQQVGEGVASPDLLFLEPDNIQVSEQIARRLKGAGYDLICAVGQEASTLVWGAGVPGKKMYVAVLDPESVPNLPADACGISLRIPVPDQVGVIARTFPEMTRIGLLFDPANNMWFFNAARETALDMGLEMVALQVDARARIAPVLRQQLGRIDLVWMIPDPTIISEKIIHYVIQQGLYRNTGVIGYNPFFTRSGALFSFEFDYRELGRQAGEKLLTLMNTGLCTETPPLYHTFVNEKMAEKLQVRWEK